MATPESSSPVEQELSSPVEQESVQSSFKISFSPLRKLQAITPEMASHYKFYEDAFVKKVKENPALAGGVALVSGLLLLRGPRRFLFRNTVGRFQSEESRIVKAQSILKEFGQSMDKLKKESNNTTLRAGFVEKELGQSMDKLKKESKNTILRAGVVEEELLRGRTKIRNAGSKIQSEIQRLSRAIYKTESEAAGLMEALREIPGRNALKLRAEVASAASALKELRRECDKLQRHPSLIQ